MTDWTAAPWLAGAALALILLVLLRRPLARLWRLALRSTAGLAVLAALSRFGPLMGITLGVNWVNALVLGILGIPGFGLLLMMQWLLAA
ncbi:MAG: pro-sigmaK processing inhibitor BofA family protein [Oscillospiraceae bacterium]|nr:pro-sigmaK processing inhibitor BofA family protein [Oscillospiraceae bacterium]